MREETQAGAPESIDISKISVILVGFSKIIEKLAFSPGKTPTTAFSAIIIPIDVLLVTDSVTELLPCEITSSFMSLKSPGLPSEGVLSLISTSTVLKAPIDTEEETESSIQVFAPQSKSINISNVSIALPSFVTLTG